MYILINDAPFTFIREWGLFLFRKEEKRLFNVLLLISFSIGVLLLGCFELVILSNKTQVATKIQVVTNKFFNLTEKMFSFFITILIAIPLVLNYIELFGIDEHFEKIVITSVVLVLIEVQQRFILKINC